MIRYGLGLLAAAGAVGAASFIAACSDDIKQDPGAVPMGTGGAQMGGSGGGPAGGASNSGGSTGTVTLPNKCEGACCPTDATCYASAAAANAPGAECMATHENTGQDHIQMRQAWIRATTPKGNTDSLVYGVLAGRSELPANPCNQGFSPLGSGGYIQIIDFFLGGSKATPGDISKDYSTVGYATYVTSANLTDTLANGFCNGEEDYKIDAKYALPDSQMSDSSAFPPGLQKPMGNATKPWHVSYTKAKRIDADFDIKADRARLLKMFDESDPANIKKDGYTGVFFYKDGYAHGFGSLGWTVVYAPDGKTHLSIPIREVETKSRFNDKDKPNCVGEYLASTLDPGGSPKCGSNSPTAPAWGGGDCGGHRCAVGSEAPATTEGYFLITELEQIYSADLLKTLCVSYPGSDPANPQKQQVETEGFYDPTNKSCHGGTSAWDPTKPNNEGIPKGDWCAATNDVATPTCHDAWKSKSLHVFVGGKIKVAADAAAKTPTCSFDTGAPNP